MTTEIEKVQGALVEFDRIEAGLADLRALYTGMVYPCDTPEGLKEATAARRAIREPRFATEEVRKEAKAPILALGRQLDAKAKYITEELQKLEGPIDAQIKIAEKRQEDAIQAENFRQIRIKERINKIALMPSQQAGQTSQQLSGQIADLQAHDLTEWAQEFIVDAEKAREQTLQALHRLHAGAVAQEAAAAAKAVQEAAERAELERLRTEAAEHKRQERERLDRIAQEEAVSKARIAAAERESTARREAAELEAMGKIADAQRAATAEADRLQRERLASEVRQAPSNIVSLPAKPKTRPSDDEIIEALMSVFIERRETVVEWLINMDLSLKLQEPA